MRRGRRDLRVNPRGLHASPNVEWWSYRTPPVTRKGPSCAESWAPNPQIVVRPFSMLGPKLDASSTFQPEMFTAASPVFVTSNQSAPTGLPLDHAATSEMTVAHPPAS